MSTTCDPIRLSTLISPAFYGVHRDIRSGGHTHYWLCGGRGSGKSSFAAFEVLYGVMHSPDANALCLRKVRRTLRDSVYHQLCWAMGMLGVRKRWDVTLERMVYRPNGASIVLRGVDHAEKVKSIRPARGYFRYVWFEELAEFSGMAEIRSILQSTLRGGRHACCLYTYNPPRSKQSWVNLEAASPTPDTLVHHSDYRSMPESWLGPAFLAGAEAIARSRPDVYEHEYLGKVTGTGREVFHNLTLRPIPDAECSVLGTLRRGLDFGYASDPSHYVVCAYDAARRRLFLLDETRLVRASNAVLAGHILEEMRRHGRGRVCCDSADPRSIDDLYLLGVPAYGAKKGPGSVEWGMRFLTGEVEEIVIDPARCPYAAKEFSAYEFAPDGCDGVLAGYPDRNNHAIDAVRYALEETIRTRFLRGKHT